MALRKSHSPREMNHNFTTFYLVRHGESEANVRRIVQGSSVDLPLTEKGRNQAAALAETLTGIHIDVFYSSHLKRAHETAEILAKKRNMEVYIDERLRERSMDTYEGMDVDEFLKLYTEENWGTLTHEEKLAHKFQDSEENFNEAYERFVSALLDIAEKNKGRTILIATHAGMIRGFLIKNRYGDFDTVGGIENAGIVS